MSTAIPQQYQAPYPQQPAPQAPYPQQPMSGQQPYPPQTLQPEETGGFSLSLVRLITGILGISIVRLILSSIGLSKSRKVKKYTHNNSKTHASFVMGIIGLIWNILAVVTQIILIIILVAVGISAVPVLNDAFDNTSATPSIENYTGRCINPFNSNH